MSFAAGSLRLFGVGPGWPLPPCWIILGLLRLLLVLRAAHCFYIMLRQCLRACRGFRAAYGCLLGDPTGNDPGAWLELLSYTADSLLGHTPQQGA